MKYNYLPNTDMKISSISLGSWVFGGVNWGNTNERVLVAAVHAAQDYGINLIDTAPIYGNGKAEEIIGRSLRKRRNHFILASKCGLVGKGKQMRHNLSRKSIFVEIDASLKRLQTDVIDIYQCHWPDSDTPIEETILALEELKKNGKIRHIGVSNFSKELFEKSCELSEIITYQGQYSLLERSVEKEIFPALKKEKVGFLSYGSLGGGILSGKYETMPSFKSSDARRFFYPFYEKNSFETYQKLLNRLRNFNRPLNQIAINWVRQNPNLLSVIVGCRNKEQVKQNMEAVQWDLRLDEIESINKMATELKIVS